MSTVLVLNSNYYPLGVLSWQKAVTLMFSEDQKIEVVESYEKEIHSVSLTIKMPAVIRLIKYVKSKKVSVRFNKTNIFIRDQGVCQYCRRQLSLHESTYDHVVPKSRGGKTDWLNIVLACKTCNLKKDSKTPDEAGMSLFHKPTKPIQLPIEVAFSFSAFRKIQPEWEKWLFNMKRAGQDEFTGTFP